MKQMLRRHTLNGKLRLRNICFINYTSQICPNIRAKSPNGRFSPKLKVEKLTRTYAVKRRIITSFQVIRPTWIDRWVLQEGDCLRDNTFPMKESNYRPQLNESSQSC
jgi:hypothetical protein